MKKIFAASLVFLAVTSLAVAAESTSERLVAANELLANMTKTSDKGVPLDLIRKSECVVVVPGLKKGGFIVGAKSGKGFVSCRHGVSWSAPAAIRIEGGSVGFQIGASESDVLLLVMNKEGAEKLLESKFTLGGDATVAAGPLGRSVAAQTDAKLTAGILSYSRARGVFAGLALQGGTLREDLDDNAEMYGSKLTNKEIVGGKARPSSPGSKLFIARLNRISRVKQ